MLVLLCGLAAASPDAARAQVSFGDEVELIGANALLGGLTAGLAMWARGEPFLEAFGLGSIGGAVQYAGKRLATARAPGAGLAGRAIGALGASMVRNVAADRGVLDRWHMPFGPIVFDFGFAPDSQGVRVRLHLGRTIFLARMIVNDELELDVAETVSAGAPVFEAPRRMIQGYNGREIGGMELWSTIALSDRGLLPPFDYGRLLAHERVHLVQDDFLNIAWADPLDDWLVRRLPWGETIVRYVDVGGAYMAIAGVFLLMLPYEDRPWEDEAARLEAGW